MKVAWAARFMRMRAKKVASALAASFRARWAANALFLTNEREMF
jgi:hypothetical protein